MFHAHRHANKLLQNIVKLIAALLPTTLPQLVALQGRLTQLVAGTPAKTATIRDDIDLFAPCDVKSTRGLCHLAPD